MAAPGTSAQGRPSTSALDRIIDRSKRTSGLQLPIGFVKDSESWKPPMAQMLRGGHGGEVRLKLYLTMALLATAAPYEIKPISGRTWATALALPDPGTNGARRVGDALSWLAKHQFVQLQRVPGEPPTVRLLSALGTGRAWQRPTAPYVTIPLAYWKERWLWKLSGAATAVLVLILDEQNRRGRPSKKGRKVPQEHPYAAFSGEERRARGLSDDTWARATQELVALDLIETGRTTTGGDELDWRRSRKTYTLKRPIFDGEELGVF